MHTDASLPTANTSSARVRRFVNVEQQIGVFTLWLFGFAFPLATGAQRIDANGFKYFTVAGVACALALLAIRTISASGSVVELTHRFRPGLILTAILAGYSLFLCGFALQVIIAAFFAPALILAFGQTNDLLRTDNRRLRNLLWLAQAFAVLTIASCFLSEQQYAAILGHPYRHTGLSTFLACLIIFWSAMWFLRGARERNITLKLLLLSSVVAGGVAIVQFLLQYEWLLRIFPPLREDPRPYGTLGHPNWFGTYLLLLLPFAIHFMFKERRWYWRALVALLHASLLICQTRGAWLGEAMMLGFVAISLRREPKRIIELAGILAVVTVILLPVHNWKILKRADSLGREANLAVQGSSGAGTGRFGFWKYAVAHLPAHVFLGAGLDSFDAMADEGEHAPISKAHSIYLDHALSSGVIGLGILLTFLWKCFWKYPPAHLQLAFRGMLIAYLVQGLFIHDTIQTLPLLWMLAGLALSPLLKPTHDSAAEAEPATDAVPASA